MTTVDRFRGAVRRRGVVGTGRLLVDRLSPLSSWSMEFVWYGLDLVAADRPRRRLEAPLALRRGTVGDMRLIEQLPPHPSVSAMSRRVVAERLGEGAELWLVTDGEQAVFSCWSFVGSAPLSDAVGGRIRLSPRTALLEDVLASPQFRGRGIAPSAYSEIGDIHAAAGLESMIMKITVDNAPSRRAVEKAGFREFGRMRLSGSIWRPRIAVALSDDDPEHRWLAALER